MMVTMCSHIHCGIGECGLDQKYAFIKKSTIFTQLLRNFVKIRYSCVPRFDKVSLWSGKNCGFFNVKVYFRLSPDSPIPHHSVIVQINLRAIFLHICSVIILKVLLSLPNHWKLTEPLKFYNYVNVTFFKTSKALPKHTLIIYILKYVLNNML